MWCLEPGELLVLPHKKELVGESFPVLYTARSIAYGQKNLSEEVHRRLVSRIDKLSAIPVVVAVPPGEEEEYARRLTEKQQVQAAMPNYHLELYQTGVKINSAAITAELKRLNAVPRPQCGTAVRIAVLDTGVDPSCVPNASLQAYQLNTDDPTNTTLHDSDGHGTLVTTIISTIAPKASILSVKVFGKHGNAASLTIGLLQAISAFDPHVINLSLALSNTPSCPHCGNYLTVTIAKTQLNTIIGHLTSNASTKPLLIAAAGNSSAGRPLLPADCTGVLGVGSYDHASQAPVYSYTAVEQDRFILANGGTSTATLGRSYLKHNIGTALHGTSFAAAFASGIAARHVCAEERQAPCAGKAVPATTPRDAALQKIKAHADTTYHGYMPQHGLGLLQY